MHRTQQVTQHQRCHNLELRCLECLLPGRILCPMIKSVKQSAYDTGIAGNDKYIYKPVIRLCNSSFHDLVLFNMFFYKKFGYFIYPLPRELHTFQLPITLLISRI